MRESDIEHYLVRRVKELGGHIRKVKWIGHNGAPDRLVLLPGCAVFVELKAPGEHPTAQQLREHTRLRHSNIPVRVVDTLAGVDNMLEGLGVC